MVHLLPAMLFGQFRVVGYVPASGTVAPVLNDTVLKKLTHLNIAFVNPDSLGKLVLPAGLDSLVQQGRAAHIKVLMSIGGGHFNPYYAALLGKNNLPRFVDSLMKLVMGHQLDGIDVDLENNAIDSNYENFIAALSAKLKPARKLLTAALATWNAALISNAALTKFDFINIMSYDQTGPWRPNEPGPHAAFETAVSDLVYWTKTRHLSKKKISLGLPFYGYGFGTTYGESMSYATIIGLFPEAAEKDMLVPVSGGAIYYNGLMTIKNKTRLALKKAGGVMIWQLLQDAAGEQSLLSAIDEAVRQPQ